jgi:ABC-type uncharacterized transport system involved in gliding motility auxiliary subunit
MNRFLSRPAGRSTRLRYGEHAGIRVPLLLLCFFLLGVGLSAYWFHRLPRQAGSPGGPETYALSDSTRAVLDHLQSPVEVRLYSFLDPAAASPQLSAFAGRVSRLLDEYQRAGHGKVSVVRHDSFSAEMANQALADGIKPFDLNKGNGCFLGIAVACDQRRQSLPQLSPQWESALQDDLSRAIENVAESKAPMSPAASQSPAAATALEEVERVIPDPASVSLEEGTRLLREAVLKKFRTAAEEMQAQVHEAEQRIIRAQQSGSAAQEQAALQQLKQVQAEQAEKLQRIASSLEPQIAALQRLKEKKP